MAKLVKASTALKRASAVDQKQLYMDNLIRHVNQAVSVGRFETDVFIPEEYVDEIHSDLLDAGYQLSFRSLSDLMPFNTNVRKGLLRRILDRVTFSKSVEELPNPFSDIDRRWVTIGWGPVPTDEGELDEELLAVL